MKKVIQLIILLPFFCFSQVKISGRIMSHTESVPFANVVLTDQSTQSIKGVVTDDKGNFELSVPKGSYKLTVDHMSYDNYSKEIIVEQDQTLEVIVLSEKPNSLETVVVTGAKKRITRKIDRMVVNIENSPIASGGNAFDALKSSPGLVLKNDQISMLGKSGVKIMVDGRMIQLSGEELKTFLNSISASDIKEVEVITTPPAKYEAEGNSGIVNIVYKKGRRNAWNNSTTLTQIQGKYGKQSLNNSFSYQKGKVSSLLTLGYNYGYEHYKELSNIFYSDRNDHLVFNQKAKLNDFSGRLLFDYNVNSTTKIGVQYLGSLTNKSTDDKVDTTILKNSGEVDSYLHGNGNLNNKNKNNLWNAHVEKQLDTIGRKMFIDLDFLDYNKVQDNNILSKNYDANDVVIGTNFDNLSNSEHKIRNYNAKIDFEHPLKFVNLSYGAKFSFSDTQYSLNNYDVLNDITQINQFEFKENIQAAYLNGSKKLSDKWEMQLGLRSEYTETKGISRLLDQVNKNDYFKIFPTFYLQYNKSDDNKFIFNYSKRLYRPNYFQLNPARYYISSQLSYMGNPYLTPSYSHNLEVSHIYKDNFTTKLAYFAQTQSFGYIFQANDAAKEQITTAKNYYTKYAYSLTETFQLKITPWWKADNTLFLNYSQSEKTDAAVNAVLKNGFEFYGSINNQITLSKAKSIVGEVNFWYDSPYNDNIYNYTKASSLDIALSFNSLIKNFKLTTGFYDIFNSSRPIMYSQVNGINQNFVSYPNNRYFRISLIYNFGNDKISTQERSFGNEQERNRSN
jgi:iron complex outermembrane receptor protein